MASLQLVKDAQNRGIRTFLQGLAIDIAVAIAVFITVLLADVDALDDLKWAVIAFSLARTVVQTVAAYVMRRFLDPSRFPTPLPPTPPGAPADPT